MFFFCVVCVCVCVVASSQHVTSPRARGVDSDSCPHMGVASSSSSDDVDARWTRDENVDEDAGEDVNAGTTTSGTTTSGTTNDDETMTFVEELEDGSTRVVRLDDDEEWDDDADDRRRSSASASALLERRVASSARAKNSAWSTTWTRVYDSARHASSFRGRGGMLERCAERGPVMMVISPRAGAEGSGAEGSGAIFAGVFSPELPATPRHDFRGDDACAAFRVDASTNDVIDTTGTSTTPVYCAYGYTTRPNGVGLFGVVGRHALFVDDALERGHADYGARTFTPARIEVWTLTSSDARPPTRAPTATDRASTASASAAAARRRADARFDARFAASSIAADIADAARG